ncbi:MAG: lipoate--protein ligase family protein [Candidatus Lokiarchaeota archaeon]|nr:lipoate--protein ligase family protein [Candidatus Lokiarchaeota archaeon]
MGGHGSFTFPAGRWRLIEDGAYPVQLGLAIDEALLDGMTDGGKGRPNTVRFYQFAPPSVVVGCNQDIREVDLPFIKSSGLQLGRRITGGGAIIMGVPRDDSQLGISIICVNEPDFPAKLGGRYAALSLPIVAALRQVGLPVEYQANSDITLHGRKIAGQAMLTTANITFMHSTITIDYDLATMLRVAGKTSDPATIAAFSENYTTIREHVPEITMERLKAALKTGLEREFHATLAARPIDDQEMLRARRLLVEKHSTDAYILDMDGASMGSCFL